MEYIAAAIAMIGSIGTAFGEGMIVTKTMDSMARNPEMYSKLRSAMMIGCGLTETAAIFCFVIAIMCLVL